MARFGSFDKNAGKKMFKKNIKQGDVFLKNFEEADHPKFFIVAGVCEHNIYLCSVFLNSNIHPALFAKQNLLNLQVPLKKDMNPFLKYDSFANCAYPIQTETEKIADEIIKGTCKVIGSIHKDDLNNIQESLINSGLLSEEEIELYFGNQ